jgi:hypothetical protein
VEAGTKEGPHLLGGGEGGKPESLVTDLLVRVQGLARLGRRRLQKLGGVAHALELLLGAGPGADGGRPGVVKSTSSHFLSFGKVP